MYALHGYFGRSSELAALVLSERGLKHRATLVVAACFSRSLRRLGAVLIGTRAKHRATLYLRAEFEP